MHKFIYGTWKYILLTGDLVGIAHQIFTIKRKGLLKNLLKQGC